MVDNPDDIAWTDLPSLIDKTAQLKDWICGLSFDQQQKLWACSDAIAQQNAERFALMDLRKRLTPALLAYDGIQYTSMAPSVFTEAQLAYVQEHLRILSGFYGALRPLDGITPYRLEMQAKTAVDGHANLYDFWGDLLYRAVMDESRVLVNLASKEYSKAIEKHLHPNDTYITCVFGELANGKVVQKSVYAKTARGEMVRYLASINAQSPADLRGFSLSGYSFDEARSDDSTYVFLR